MIDQRMSGALQENVLTLLCFDTESAKVIRHAVTPQLFEGKVYQDIASQAIAFFDKYGEAIKEHLPDVVEDELNSDDKRKASLYKRTLENLYSARAHINVKYVVSQLQEFVHQQTLKAAILTAVEKIEAGQVDAAELALSEGMKAQMPSFDIGTELADTQHSLRFLSAVDDGIPTGIKVLDVAGVMPSPGTMFLMIAPAKKGKSWFLVHAGRFALHQRKRVLHITLEMSEELVAQRYVQCFFSVTKRQAVVAVPAFRRDESGRFVGVEFEEVARPTLGDAGVRKMIEKNIKKQFRNGSPLIIKGFPTSSLTISHLKVYLDTLERLHKFVPDVVTFDYPDLMAISSDSVRTETGQVFKQLRGLAVERNFALVTVTQGNRDSSTARVTTDAHVAEDYSKIATADCVITYSQSQEEKRLGLARLFVSNSRSEEDKFMVLITQSYAMGQFAIDSTRMGSEYWRYIDTQAAPNNDEKKK